jgi:toxin ParE1/3/4
MTVRLYRQALGYIREIRAYTVGRWGEDQWLHYFAALSSALERIASDPGCGRPRDLIRDGMRSLPFRQHLIFFQSTRDPDGKVAILRIVHERRNIAALSYHDDLEG